MLQWPPFSATFRSRICGSLAKRVFHISSLTKATRGAYCASSESLKLHPRKIGMPKALKVSAETCRQEELFGLVAATVVHRYAAERRHVFEDVGLHAVIRILHRRSAHVRPLLAFLADGAAHHQDEPVGIAHWQRAKQHCVHNRKDCVVAAVPAPRLGPRWTDRSLNTPATKETIHLATRCAALGWQRRKRRRRRRLSR